MVPLRSATTLLATPALISDWVPMIERVRPAQLTMMVVSGSGAASSARSTSSPPGTLIEPGMFMVVYSSKRRTSRILILALRAIRAGDFFRRQRGRVTARLHQFAKRLGVGIDVLEQFKARVLPGLQPAVERADVGVAQRVQAIRRLGNKAFAGVVDDDRRHPCAAAASRLRAQSGRRPCWRRTADGRWQRRPRAGRRAARFPRAARVRCGLARG